MLRDSTRSRQMRMLHPQLPLHTAQEEARALAVANPLKSALPVGVAQTVVYVANEEAMAPALANPLKSALVQIGVAQMPLFVANAARVGMATSGAPKSCQTRG